MFQSIYPIPLGALPEARSWAARQSPAARIPTTSLGRGLLLSTERKDITIC